MGGIISVLPTLSGNLCLSFYPISSHNWLSPPFLIPDLITYQEMPGALSASLKVLSSELVPRSAAAAAETATAAAATAAHH